MAINEGRLSFAVHCESIDQIRIEISVYSLDVGQEPKIIEVLEYLISGQRELALKHLHHDFLKDEEVLKALSFLLSAYPNWKIEKHLKRSTNWDAQKGHTLIVLAKSFKESPLSLHKRSDIREQINK